MSAADRESRFERRPVLTLAVLGAGLLLALTLVLELGLRLTLDYHIDYYAGVSKPGWTEYPYGRIHINSHGHPDIEWDLTDARPRVGFYGDSVTYGVGAGHGHRLADLVADALPERQVLTFAAVGARLKDPERVAALAEQFGLDSLVYVMNLNDLTPDRPRERAGSTPKPEVASTSRTQAPQAAREAPAAPGSTPRAEPATSQDEGFVRRLRAFVLENEGSLRTRSYLYNFLRLRAKNLLVRMGYESSGFRAVELEPGKHPDVFDATAARVNATAARLAESGVRFCVLLLPYEMQISSQAEERYRELGVPFDDDFVGGRTQREVLARLGPGLPVLDGLDAFLDSADPESSRESHGLGVYFVYDRGDKIDWNHPTREGHARLANLVLARGFCGLGPTEPGEPQP